MMLLIVTTILGTFNEIKHTITGNFRTVPDTIFQAISFW